MNDDDPGAAEQRTLALLGLLREEPPSTDRALTDSVMRTARWQYTVRGALSVINDLSGAFVEGALLACGIATHRGDREERR